MRLTVGAFVTPDFGIIQSKVYFRSGVWLDVPLKGFQDEAPSITVQLGATY